MKLQALNVRLGETTRSINLDSGLNIISGPAGTGKTNALRLIHGLVGGNLKHLAPEVREHVPLISGRINLMGQEYNVVRNIGGDEAVEISGPETALRVPAYAPSKTAPSYNAWLLQKMGLPETTVPKALTDPASDPTSLSVTDFLMYCYLRQDEIDTGIFGSATFKDIKRRYVFEVLYGIRTERQGELENQLRALGRELQTLGQSQAAFELLLQGSKWGNRAEIERQLQAAQAAIEAASKQAANAAPPPEPKIDELRRQVLELGTQISQLTADLNRDTQGESQLSLLIDQLRGQRERVTRAVVSRESFVGFEFLLCPRCSTKVSPSRGPPDTCYLCQQPTTTKGTITKQSLVAEIDRIEAQIDETVELSKRHVSRRTTLEAKLAQVYQERSVKSQELDRQTANFVSASAARIADASAVRARAESEVIRFRDYLDLYRRRDDAAGRRAKLDAEREDVLRELSDLNFRREKTEQGIKQMETEFTSLVMKFRVSKPEVVRPTTIDRRNFMPLAHGEKFDELSQGTKVLVHVAYAIAQHRTALKLKLPLPSLLIIDGLTDNLGKEGLDGARIELMYKELLALAHEFPGEIQIIVGDHEGLPAFVKPFDKLHLTDADKLVPLSSTPA